MNLFHAHLHSPSQNLLRKDARKNPKLFWAGTSTLAPSPYAFPLKNIAPGLNSSCKSSVGGHPQSRISKPSTAGFNTRLPSYCHSATSWDDCHHSSNTPIGSAETGLRSVFPSLTSSDRISVSPTTFFAEPSKVSASTTLYTAQSILYTVPTLAFMALAAFATVVG